jgi:hypothetical protein
MGNLELEVEFLQNRVSILEQEVASLRSIFGQINQATKIGESEATKEPYPSRNAGAIFNCLIRGEAITTEQMEHIVAYSSADNYSNSGDFCRELIVAFKKLVTKHCGTDECIMDFKYDAILQHLKDISKLSNMETRKKEKNVDKKKDLLKTEKMVVRKFCCDNFIKTSGTA